MNFENLILEELKSKKEVEIDYLNEGVIPLNAILAFLTLKRNALNKIKSVSKVTNPAKKVGREITADALIAKEKARAETGRISGKGEDAVTYKLTKKQLEILSQIQEKYGNEIVDEVMSFRKNILAPYQIIKRLVKNNKIVTAKDKFGMTHAQYRAAVESGLKKLDKRGTFTDRDDNSQKILDDLSLSIDALRELRKDFVATGRLRESIVGKVLKYYDLGTADFEESLDDLRRTYDELKKNERLLSGFINKPEKLEKDPIAAQDLVKRNIELRKGIIRQERETEVQESVLKESADYTNSDEFKKGGSFNAALGKYMLRRNIIDELKVEKNNVYKKTYISIIDKLIDKAIERRKEILVKKVKGRTNIDFNEIERKIFKIKPGIKQEYSSNPDDYVQVIKDEDFGDPEYVKRPEELVNAENKIEAEVKRFERFLKRELELEDFNNLKKYKLINDLVTISELKNPNELFKSPEEIRAMRRSQPYEEDPEVIDDDDDIEDEKDFDEI